MTVISFNFYCIVLYCIVLLRTDVDANIYCYGPRTGYRLCRSGAMAIQFCVVIATNRHCERRYCYVNIDCLPDFSVFYWYCDSGAVDVRYDVTNDVTGRQWRSEGTR